MDLLQPNNHFDAVESQFPISGDPSKYVTLPVINELIWRKYQTTLEWFWTAHDIYMANDQENFNNTFSDEQKTVCLDLLTFMFTSHQAIVNKELFMDFMSQVDIKEAIYYFGSQADAKKTHCTVYSQLIEELTRNSDGLDNGKNKLVPELLAKPFIRDFLKWSIWNTTHNSLSFLQRLFTFACIQGIIFNVTFLVFKWYQKQYSNMMPGLCNSNDLIWRDEKLNLSLSCMLFGYIQDDEFDEALAHKLTKECVQFAKQIFTSTIPVDKFNIQKEHIGSYIEHAADKILNDIGMGKIYKTECPFDWVDDSVIDSHPQKSMNVITDMSASFGEAKFDTDLEF